MRTGKYRRLLKYPLRQWPSLVAIIALTFLTSAISVLQPWPLKLAIDYALGDASVPVSLNSILSGLPISTSTGLLLLAGVASVGLFFVNTILQMGMTRVWTGYGEKIVYELAGDLFYKLQRASLFSHDRTVGDSLTRLTGDTYCLYGLIENVMSPIQHVLTLATVGYVAWQLDPRLTALALLIAPFQAGSAVFFAPRLKRRSQQNRNKQSSLFAFVHQTLTSIPLVQAFGAEDRNSLQFQRLAANAVTLSQRGALLGSAYGMVNGFTSVLCNALVLYVGSQRVLSGAVSTGSLLVFLAYTRSIQGALGGLLSMYTRLKQNDVSIERSLEILDLDEGVQDAPGAKALSFNAAGQRGHLCLENVTFGYEPERPVLKEISLEAHPGEIVAIVGQTGAGKSTLVSLIPRFMDPWVGRVTIDGTDLRDIQLASLRKHVALVLQEPFLLPLTIAENIAYGRPEASREEVMQAAAAANADQFIRRLPEGYDTPIGERGATLSGGEKQRISIARALLKNAPILILDEPSSALDAETEALLMEAIERLVVGRTTLIIAHRLSTIRNADRIVVLNRGHVVEVGTHTELLTHRSHYHRFHTLQFNAVASEASE